MDDIAALQSMYGANYTTNGGATTYAWSPTTGEMSINGVRQGAPGANRIFQTVWDGGGTDTYDFSAYNSGLTVDLQPGAWTKTSTAQLAKLSWDGSKVAVGNIANARLYNDDLRSLIENAKGGTAGDVIKGNVGANALWGNGGNDKLYGLDGNDSLDGGAGADVLDGGTGTDTAIFGGQLSDYRVTTLADGSLQIQDLRAGAPDGTDVVWNTEWFQFVDALCALDDLTRAATPAISAMGLMLTGGAGNDQLAGGEGDDKLYGLAGNDALAGGAGKDLLSGGAGLDTVTYATAAAGVRADLYNAAVNTGEAYGDTYSGIENLTGSEYADDLRGDGGANAIKGGAGNDLLFGRGGNDVLNGGLGDDTLYGQAGQDKLLGGDGRDTFVFSAVSHSPSTAPDTISDFVRGVDRIDLRGIDANANLAGDQAFSFIGTSVFSGAAGQLRFSAGVLSGDINGDRVADFAVKVAGLSVLAKGDFYL
jgi:serralysin